MCQESLKVHFQVREGLVASYPYFHQKIPSYVVPLLPSFLEIEGQTPQTWPEAVLRLEVWGLHFEVFGVAVALQ